MTDGDRPGGDRSDRAVEADWPATGPNEARVVRVVGPSDSGKTTLVEGLASRLSETCRVATIKSIHHDVELDTPGSDTHRHRRAGAETVVGITPSLTFEMSRRDGAAGGDRSTVDEVKRRELFGALDRLSTRGFDVILVEGFSDVPLPAIRVGDDPRIEGPVVGTGEDDLGSLAATIRALDPYDGPDGRGSDGPDERSDH